MAAAMMWVSHVTTVSTLMALPALGGYWLDAQFNTAPWLVICGAVIGFYLGMSHLLRLAKAAELQQRKNKP